MAFRTKDIAVLVGAPMSNKLRAEYLLNDMHYVIKNREDQHSGLLCALNKHGIRTLSCEESWPRDFFAYHNGHLHTKKEKGILAEGGCLIFGPDFLLAPDSIATSLNLPPERVQKVLCELYSVKRAYLVPRGYDHKGWLDHLDLHVLLIENPNILVVTSLLDRIANGIYKGIAQKEGLEYLVIRDIFGTNSISFIDDAGKIIIFAPKPSEYDKYPLAKALESTEALIGVQIEVIEVPFNYFQLSNGSIRCKTNILPVNFDPNMIPSLF